MQISSDSRTLYDRIGGEAVLRHLVQRFYQHMDELAEAGSIRAMHAPDLSSAQDKLFMFLSGWMGGPQLYMEKFGHPRLRMRHLPFAIDEAARDQWMLCMRHALDEVVDDQTLRDELMHALYGVADFMRNKPMRNQS
ncbi:MAG: globin [Zetaproteobacteria bacterium CG12_big_fil_rev_8_21_14_0_65_55_1124]|nr:MAG: globin [Zetaproteobacteria bacterium CG08_land_8_20_14_0_20_55_17]PIW43303.1 MAG: globin [Zetaproteobacteria bacterium CG12_big_fil_rev_8_21_14_0_65_55_1124]PIY52211.1 MAG: globin [Zetaproteobacteria bacterium CG_4_10_14_0_8_um_filter_55_43]PIZ40261.1 MAG: globin [Zetaproteobacteria bacterium CG_4_10_14_0_2_um_filter_55_20]PJB79010.1 MAG: globin [Zetaproteobacteria bacterium CG_4_9_14_0_8_um_filter_55_31]